MNRLLKISLLILMMTAVRTGAEAQTPTAIDMIKANYREILAPSFMHTDTLTADMVRIEPETEMSDQVVIELHERYPFDLAKIDRYLNALRSDG